MKGLAIFGRPEGSLSSRVPMECRWPISAATGISQATYFNWKRKYDGLLPTEMGRAQTARGREQQAAEGGRRSGPRQRDAAGHATPKCMVRSVRARFLDMIRTTVA